MSYTYAFFDFDETVFRHKSMFEFAEYYLEAIDELHGAARFGKLMDQVNEMASLGHSRGEINRFYYSQFAGHSEKLVERLGGEWYESLCDSGKSYLIESTVEKIEELRAGGAGLVIVSGAFAPIVSPFAKALGFSDLICSTPVVVAGVYTGAIDDPVIGEEKAVRVTKFLDAQNVPPNACCAFGDHKSDLPLLEAVGTATVVNPDLDLERRAREKGWTVLRG